MAGYQDNLMNETSDNEMNLNYQTISLSYEDDENDEGMAEYLDLDMENTSVEDAADVDKYSNRENGVTASNQSSLTLRNNYNVKKTTSCSRDIERKCFSDRSTTPKNQTQTAKATMAKNKNPFARGTKRKTPNNYGSVDVITTVNEINATFANSKNFVSNNATNKTQNLKRKDSSSKCESTAVKKKPDLDGVDLFFQSMAQTVVSLPVPIQARIKMDICKIIAKAEMKYSTKTDVSEVLYSS
ncbi:uncharacterized protein [Venturia canescens]|uniref:uncharacterized protein n=1 Tax=Venturia canescens TaxID=32260 RepID=UPI001C9BC2CD|nr:uncharacterized protein LOC122406543 [Venturia canescens]